jgi:predicted secreted protein
MDIISGLAVFFLIWWIVLFCVLPLGITPPAAADKIAGAMSGAPAHPQLGRKALITTCIAIILWLVVFALVQSDLISFREMVKNL